MIMGPDTNKKSVASLILARMKPDGKTADMGVEGEESAEITEGERSAGEEIMTAIEGKDVVGVVMAIKNLIELMDSPEPDADDEPTSAFTE